MVGAATGHLRGVAEVTFASAVTIIESPIGFREETFLWIVGTFETIEPPAQARLHVVGRE